MPVFSTHFKSDGISISLHTTRIYNGKTMPNLETSSKKLHIIRTAIRLFTTYGFHTTGVDLIVKESEIPKATLYNYFHSKERLIEMCIAFQKVYLKKTCLRLFIQAVIARQPISSRK